MKKWIEQIKNKIKSQEFDKKQLFLGIIIFIVAIIFFVLAFHSKQENLPQTNTFSKAITNKLNQETRENRVSNIIAEEKQAKLPDNKPIVENVVLNFEAVTERDMNYKIYYTTQNGAPFDQDQFVLYRGKSGENKYSIQLPVSQIDRFRLQFEAKAGNVTIKNLSLSGAQQVDLNKFEMYEFWQMENIHINEDNSMSFFSRSSAPSLLYYPSLMAIEETEEFIEDNETKENEETIEEKE